MSRRLRNFTFEANANSHVVSPSGVSLDEMWVTNLSGGDLYLQVFDAASLPANGATPIYSILVVDQSTVAHDFQQSMAFRNGCVMALSSTPGTLTVDTSGANVFGSLRN